MILAAVEIENYKQYAGSHCIDFPEQGMVAITGPNGAGKTTLFEAIEWCLYGPRTIPHASIPPHGGVGATRVSVTLQDPHDGRRYVVRRTLRNGVSSAEAYSEDDPGQPVVQGPRDVSDFVARQLVGLPHAAFVSTFFTRQKELTFFGDRTPTERRVEVARLLGFQTIRDAQEEIGEERSDVRQEATSLRAQYERDAAGRDFEAEIAEAESAVTTAERLATTCQQQLTDADAAYARAREELERWRGLQEQDAAYERELLTIAGVAQAATSRQEAAQAELHRLQALATERTALEPEAAQIDENAQLVKTLEAERERSRRLETLRKGRQAHGAQLAETAVVLRRVVESHTEAASDLDGWNWSEADGGDPCQAAARLGRAVAPLDPRALRLRAERLARAIDLANRTEAARRNLEQYQSHRSKLTAQRDEFLDKGEPGARLHAAEAAATGARAALEQAIGKLTEARQKRQESEELERIFDERTFNRICPTCTRPITDVEAARLLHSLRESTERVRAEEAAQVAALAAAQAQVATADAERAAANELMQKLASLNERLSDGERMIAELEAEHTRELAELDSILAAAGLHAPPQPTEVEAAQAAAERGAQLATLAGTLEQLGHRAAMARDGMLEADSEIMALGPVSYDEEAHQNAVSTLDAARHAAAAIKRIDIELRAQPAYEATRREAERELADLERQTQDVEQARQALGFDIVALREARGAEAAVAEAQKAAREELAQAREALRDAQTALRRVIEDRDRLLGIVEAAERRGREADELERMYREFAEFDKFVADHVGPLLAETTERLLSLVTHGKYDRVRFDENYGIEVFDGDECFKLEGFSGGERDVVALCARLAMSELVGSSALRPPRFLVLDEVFGSLDSERRSQLLETLGSLAYGGHFQQMFIISHVDDVQQSPVMNEAWTIEERAGVSHVVRPESLTPALA